MAHHSRLCAALVDVPDADYAATTEFWSGALGKPPSSDTQDPDYAELGEVMPGLHVMIQRVGAPPRVHLDIETDDVDAEVARLEALGATKVEKVKSWQVMRDPAGLLFCVVRPQTADFPKGAARWE